LIVKAGGRTPPVSFHPSRNIESKSTAEDVAVDLEAAKKGSGKAEKICRL
jgi:hypothetical protein